MIITVPFSLQIVIIEYKSIICPGYNAVLHIHTCIEEVQITVRPKHQKVRDKYFCRSWSSIWYSIGFGSMML